MIIHWQSNHTYYPWYGNIGIDIAYIIDIDRLTFDLDCTIGEESNIQDILCSKESDIQNIQILEAV